MNLGGEGGVSGRKLGIIFIATLSIFSSALGGVL